MNKVINESINTVAIKNDLKGLFETKKEKNILKSLGSMKVFGIWLEKRLNFSTEKANQLLSPFFVLYDLRIASAHLQSDEKTKELYLASLKRLELEENCQNYITIYDKLILKLKELYIELNKL